MWLFLATSKRRDLSLKGRALIINGLLTSTLWYQAANIHFPTWAIQDIEDLIYDFMWNGKRPLINHDILALPLAEGDLNIPRLATKIQALRLNTIRRLLSHEQAHWKYLTSHFLRLSHMPTGKHKLALEFNVQHIDPAIPHFHKDLLTAWLHHTKHHTRTNPPATLADILHEPLFKNPLIIVNDNPLYYREWIKADLSAFKISSIQLYPDSYVTWQSTKSSPDTMKTLPVAYNRRNMNCMNCNEHLQITNRTLNQFL